MAENKRSFVLYADQYELFKKLPNEQAGELIKHIFAYVNDENPTTDNLLIEIAFEPIKAQLKRDLKRWEHKIEARSRAGKASAEAKKANKEQQDSTNSTYVDFVQQTSTQSTDNVNDNVNVNVNVNDNVNVNHKDKEREANTGEESPTLPKSFKSIEERKATLIDKLKPYVEVYGKDMLNDFFNYWTEKNENGKKMRYEMERIFDIEKRLLTWFKREKTFKQSHKKNIEDYDFLTRFKKDNTPDGIANR